MCYCVVGVLMVECGWHVTGAVWIALTLSVKNLLISCCLLGSSCFSDFLIMAEMELFRVASAPSHL